MAPRGFYQPQFLLRLCTIDILRLDFYCLYFWVKLETIEQPNLVGKPVLNIEENWNSFLPEINSSDKSSNVEKESHLHQSLNRLSEFLQVNNRYTHWLIQTGGPKDAT